MNDEILQKPKFHWGNYAEYYRKYRPGPPTSYYDHLQTLGVGLPGQTVLELGTGPGFLACEFARRGSRVFGIDMSQKLINQAELHAKELGIEVDFRVANVEQLPDFKVKFDLVIANMCWGYFDQAIVLNQLAQLMLPRARLVVSKFNRLDNDPVVQETTNVWAELGIKPNSRKQGHPVFGYKDLVEDPRFRRQALIFYHQPISFTTDTWLGRCRAAKPFVSNNLTKEQIEQFDTRLRHRLNNLWPDNRVMVNYFVYIQAYEYISTDGFD